MESLQALLCFIIAVMINSNFYIHPPQKQTNKHNKTNKNPNQPTKQTTFNILLTLYHINIALNAFSFEQDPQDMVITCDRPLGATCQQREHITPKY